MREIKFRGKRTDNGEWVYGYYFESFTGIPYVLVLHDHILNITELYEVDTETVGQFTGLLDKDGKEIYEGDVVTANWYDCDELNRTTTGVVEFAVGWAVYWIADYKNKVFSEMNAHGSYAWDIEVIGNIHDSPELLGGDSHD